MGKTILLADDDQFIAIAYKAGLESAGYRVIVAANGQETLDILRATPPDLLLLDLIMPKISGFEVLEAMQSENLLAAIPVVVLTNLSQESDETEVRSYGVRDFLVKADVSLNDLLVRIDQVLQSSSTPAPDTEAPTSDDENSADWDLSEAHEDSSE